MGLFDSIGGFFGGNQGGYYQPTAYNYSTAGVPQQQGGAGSQVIGDALFGRYGSTQNNLQTGYQGKASASDLISNPQYNQGDAARMASVVAQDPILGTKLAQEQLNQDQTYKSLYGNDPNSTLSKTIAQQSDLSSRGYSLQPEDYEAYGQASGNIARQFGGQEQSLAQALASRGLSQAPSGAAGAAFSGLYGNKNEQLGQMQQQIAQQRMQTNMQRVAETNQFLSQLSGQQQQALQSQYGRQMSGVASGRQGEEAGSQVEQGRNQQETQNYLAGLQTWMGAQNAAQASQKSKEDNYNPGLFESGAQGVKGGFGSGMSYISGGGVSQLGGKAMGMAGMAA